MSIEINAEDKVIITKLAKKGKTSKEIREILPQYATQQIAAVKAWNTMSKTKIFKKEKITDVQRATVLRLLKKGLKTSQIVTCLQGRVSSWQVAAVHAWVTMGKY